MEIIIAILLFVISIDISNIHSAIKDLSNTIRETNKRK